MLLTKYIHINMDKNKRPKLYTLPDTLHTPSSPRRRPDPPGVACLVSSADRCSVCSVRACVPVRGLLWAVCLAFGMACAAACALQSVRVRWGLGSPPEGHIGSAGGGAGQSSDFQSK